MLPDGIVQFSIPAQRHAITSHPDTFMSCLPFLSETVLNPTHVGQSPKHMHDGFELVKEVQEAGLIVLIAVVIRPTNSGIYNVSSTYPIKMDTLQARVRKKHLFAV